jgi:hypothetical protein
MAVLDEPKNFFRRHPIKAIGFVGVDRFTSSAVMAASAGTPGRFGCGLAESREPPVPFGVTA